MAVWALESGYGTSKAAQVNNLGGIKSYKGGKKHNKNFETIDDFYTSFAAIFDKPCYRNDMQPKTVKEYLRAMQYSCCSYHHSSSYTRKINYIIKRYKLEDMNILVGCEESQAITKELRKNGHNAYSCDLLPCSGGIPQYHLQIDIFKAIDLKEWDLIILHPPCTAIAVSGNAWYGKEKPKHHERLKAVNWTIKLWEYAKSKCNKVALENPVGVLNSMGHFPKPQYIQPWQFGHGETKKTGFWLHGLPKLNPTNIVEGREQLIWKMPPSADRGKLRSKTYTGIARAIAEQWTKGK